MMCNDCVLQMLSTLILHFLTRFGGERGQAVLEMQTLKNETPQLGHS